MGLKNVTCIAWDRNDPGGYWLGDMAEWLYYWQIHRGVTYSGLDSCGVWWSQNDYRAQVGSLGQVTPPTSHNRDKLCTRTESWKVEPFVLGCFTSTYISVSFSLWFGLCAGVIFWLSTLNSFRMPILADRQFQIFSDKYSPLGLWLKY